MTDLQCTKCLQGYPDKGTPYKCIYCGALYDYKSGIKYNSQLVDDKLPGIWRYRHTFNLPEEAPIVYLGEGNTPLVWGCAFKRDVAFKLESLNPTGSFKDRGSAVLVSFLKSRFVNMAIEDSSGNAGSSFAAYAIRAGIKARIYIPDYASGPKRVQIGMYGAEVVNIKGSRSATTKAVLQAAENGEVYASHAYFPMGILGFATTAYEIIDQLGDNPGAVITPVGQGNLLIGLMRGFRALYEANVIIKIPQFVGVQAKACAPLWNIAQGGLSNFEQFQEGETIAEGVRIKNPLRADLLLELMIENAGLFVAVGEEDILSGRDKLAQMGFFVEPTSALVWNALHQTVDMLQDPIVVILTGAGLKSF